MMMKNLKDTSYEEYKQNAHAGSRTRVTSMGGLYDTATLRALMGTTGAASIALVCTYEMRRASGANHCVISHSWVLRCSFLAGATQGGVCLRVRRCASLLELCCIDGNRVCRIGAADP